MPDLILFGSMYWQLNRLGIEDRFSGKQHVQTLLVHSGSEVWLLWFCQGVMGGNLGHHASHVPIGTDSLKAFETLLSGLGGFPVEGRS